MLTAPQLESRFDMKTTISTTMPMRTSRRRMSRKRTTETFLQPRMTRTRTPTYDDLGDLIAQTAQHVFVPPRRMTVSEWADEFRFINQPGAFVGGRKSTRLNSSPSC